MAVVSRSWPALLVCLLLAPAHADWSGDVGVELRGFWQSPVDPRQHNLGASLYLAPEYYSDWDEGDQRLVFAPFARLDQHDSERSHFDLREFYWRKSYAGAELAVGLRKVFWGVTESRHLVDIINQTDFVENLDTEDKLGQPMVSLRLIRDWGNLEFFVLPYFRERTFAGVEGRPRVLLPVDTDNPVYESGAEEQHVDWAVRWSHFIGDFDVGLAHFSGTARDPRLLPRFSPGAPLSLVPHYDQLEQTSLDLQATKGDWLWKLELATGERLRDRFTAAVAGFERTLYGVFESPADLGLIVEYQFDDRAATFTPFQNDVALGGRLAFNDTQSSELLLVSGIDLDNQGRFTSIEGSRRIGQNYKASIELRIFSSIPAGDPFAELRNDDYLELVFARFF